MEHRTNFWLTAFTYSCHAPSSVLRRPARFILLPLISLGKLAALTCDLLVPAGRVTWPRCGHRRRAAFFSPCHRLLMRWSCPSGGRICVNVKTNSECSNNDINIMTFWCHVQWFAGIHVVVQIPCSPPEWEFCLAAYGKLYIDVELHHLSYWSVGDERACRVT